MDATLHEKGLDMIFNKVKKTQEARKKIVDHKTNFKPKTAAEKLKGEELEKSFLAFQNEIHKYDAENDPTSQN